MTEICLLTFWCTDTTGPSSLTSPSEPTIGSQPQSAGKFRRRLSLPTSLTSLMKPSIGPNAPCGTGTPLFSPCPFTSSSFPPFYFSLSFICFTYFLLLSISSLSTRIVPLRLQAGGRRRRPNLGLVCVLLCFVV